MAGLIDLDELSLRCRDEQAKRYIQEAVACYKAGGFRSCIVATWNAVIFDYFHKLRELDMAGDANAKTKLDEYERIREGGESKLKEALDYERDILNVAATQFELLTPLEKHDLERLQHDRNRSAHPSMQNSDDPYQPTAELARTHLRNAVEIMLEREPVQGKAAFNRICNEVKSSYFPTDVANARTHFQHGPLKRARKSLIRSLVIGFAKAILNGDFPSEERNRLQAALAAIVEMHRSTAEEILRTELPGICSIIDDKKLYRVAHLASKIDVTWDAIGPACQGKVNTLIASGPADNNGVLLAIVSAIKVPAIRQSALDRAKTLPIQSFAKIVVAPRADYLDRAIQEYRSAGSFRGAEQVGQELIVPLASVMDVNHISEVLVVARSNNQIYDAGGTQDILCAFFDMVKQHHNANKQDWQKFLKHVLDLDVGDRLGVTHHYSELREKMETEGMWPIPNSP